MMNNGPDVVISGKSQDVVVDGYRFSIQIYRLETDKTWTLEVVDQDGTSHVWEEEFKTDRDACDIALQELEKEGAVAFMRGSNVIPFRQR
jgi:hypothetical protein